MKTVFFLGQNWEVPEWAEYITQDWDGEICVWEEKPDLIEDGEYWNDTRYEHVGFLAKNESIKKI